MLNVVERIVSMVCSSAICRELSVWCAVERLVTMNVMQERELTVWHAAERAVNVD